MIRINIGQFAVIVFALESQGIACEIIVLAFDLVGICCDRDLDLNLGLTKIKQCESLSEWGMR